MIELGIASFYGHSWDTAVTGQYTASGEAFNADLITFAHKTGPLKRWAFFICLDTGRMAWAWLNDRGPYVEGRSFDASEALAERLGFIEAGTARCLVIRF